MKCDIIIPIWNQLDYTRECIEHIVRNTSYPYRLILIDNGSDGPTRDYLRSLVGDDGEKARQVEVTLIRNEENLGYVKAVNQGLKVSTAPYICMFNNDTLPAPGWLERMIDFAQAHKDVGLINPVCNGHGESPIDAYAKSLERNKGVYMEMNQCQGFCLLLKREVIDAIGYLDESFGVGGYDDTDYSMRAHLAGYKCVAIHDAYVYHRLHASFDKAGNREEWVRRNQNIYYGKWGKHLRAGIVVNARLLEDEAVGRLVDLAYGLAREWTWVHIWINSKDDRRRVRERIESSVKKKALPLHQNIRIDHFNLPGALFDLTVSGKLLERMRARMRDKRFDGVIVLEKEARGILALCAKIVHASVIGIAPDVEVADWKEKGRTIALYLKKRRKEYE